MGMHTAHRTSKAQRAHTTHSSDTSQCGDSIDSGLSALATATTPTFLDVSASNRLMTEASLRNTLCNTTNGPPVKVFAASSIGARHSTLNLLHVPVVIVGYLSSA